LKWAVNKFAGFNPLDTHPHRPVNHTNLLNSQATGFP